MRCLIVLLRSIALSIGLILGAVWNSAVAQTPQPVTSSPAAPPSAESAPVSVSLCAAVRGNAFLTDKLVEQFGGLHVIFKNVSDKIIRRATFTVNENGSPIGTRSNAGNITPGSTIDKEIGDKSNPFARTDDISCFVSKVEFADGTTWQSAAGLKEDTAIASQPDAPVQIQNCDAGLEDPPQNDTVVVAVTFKNVDPTRGISAVKFQFKLADAFGSMLATETGTVRGLFSPGVIIEPSKNLKYAGPGTFNGYNTTVGSSAFAFLNPNNRELARFGCSVVAVQFRDGTVWPSVAKPDK
jgi:hypothetical protein